jgi:hypothetical protein
MKFLRETLLGAVFCLAAFCHLSLEAAQSQRPLTKDNAAARLTESWKQFSAESLQSVSDLKVTYNYSTDDSQTTTLIARVRKAAGNIRWDQIDESDACETKVINGKYWFVAARKKNDDSSKWQLRDFGTVGNKEFKLAQESERVQRNILPRIGGLFIDEIVDIGDLNIESVEPTTLEGQPAWLLKFQHVIRPGDSPRFASLNVRQVGSATLHQENLLPLRVEVTIESEPADGKHSRSVTNYSQAFAYEKNKEALPALSSYCEDVEFQGRTSRGEHQIEISRTGDTPSMELFELEFFGLPSPLAGAEKRTRIVWYLLLFGFAVLALFLWRRFTA